MPNLCQESNSLFLIQTSEKGMSLAVKLSIQELSAVLSHLLPTHTSKTQHQDHDSTLQSSYSAKHFHDHDHFPHLNRNGPQRPLQQAGTMRFCSYDVSSSQCNIKAFCNIHPHCHYIRPQPSEVYSRTARPAETDTDPFCETTCQHIHSSAHIARKMHICADTRIMRTMMPAR